MQRCDFEAMFPLNVIDFSVEVIEYTKMENPINLYKHKYTFNTGKQLFFLIQTCQPLFAH